MNNKNPLIHKKPALEEENCEHDTENEIISNPINNIYAEINIKRNQ